MCPKCDAEGGSEVVQTSVLDQLANFADLPFSTKAYYTVIFVSLGYFAVILVSYLLRVRRDAVRGLNKPAPYAVEEIALYNGSEKHMPRYIAMTDGRVMDITEFVKEEKNKALLDSAIAAAQMTKAGQALGDLCKVQLTTGEPGELASDKMLQISDLESKISKSCLQAGQLVESLRLTLEELAEYKGAKENGRLLLSIQGRIFDVTSGSQFYGPQGFYPFAGHEVARALARTSLDEKDCSSKIDDLTKAELDTLKEWVEKFEMKYPVVGTIVTKA